MKIAPCIFCNNDFPGSEKDPDYYVNHEYEELEDWTLYWVQCDECGANGPSEMSQEDAINAWNNHKAIDYFKIKYHNRADHGQ